MTRTRSVLASVIVLCGLLLWLTPTVFAQQEQSSSADSAPANQGSSAEALGVYSDAASFQNNGAFELAVEEWTRFLQRFADDPLAPKAYYYLGICHLQLKQYDQAIEAFQAVVRDHGRSDVVEDAMLNLAWSHFSLAKQDQPQRYEQAAAAFADLAKRFPEGQHAAKAFFYLGESHYARGQKQEAITAYRQLLQDFPQSPLRCETLYALGVTHEELGQYAAAGQVYSNFLNTCADHRLAAEVRMRKAETLLQTGKPAEAEQLFNQAASHEGFADADHALMRQAFSAAQQGKFAVAAELYAQLPDRFASSRYVEEAQISAGRSFYRANDFQRAAAIFQQLLAPDSAYALEAAHWLSRIYLSTGRAAEALQLTDRMLAQAGSSQTAEAQEMLVQLQMDRADALYELPDRATEALQQYTQIAAQHPQHELAPQAIYNAAFGALHLQQYQQAIQRASAFLDAHSDHRLAPDVQHIVAEALLQQGEAAEAEQRFRQLIAAHPGHAESPTWQLRLLLALFLQEEYSDLVATAGNLSGKLKAAAQRAELHHLTGASHFHLDQFAQAEQSLRAAIDADATWREADESLLLLSRAQQAQQKIEEAQATIRRLIEQYPQSPLLDHANYRLGQYAYNQGNYAQAMAHYQTVLTNWPMSELAPFALYGKGWSQLKSQQYAAAAQTLSQLIQSYPDHSATADAYFARAMSRRQAGELQGAVADIDQYLRADSPPQKADALYERGLALVALQQHQQAAETFRQLLELQPDYQHADKVLYELAWSHKSAQQDEQALAAFRQLAERFPDSPLAAEAFFHLGEEHYDRGEYAEAVAAYEQSQQRTPSGELGEKADYKLGWSHFQLEQYDLALAQFNHQTLVYPQGPLYAEGLFMKGECLFQLDNYSEALPAYQAALQAKPASEQIAALAILHAGQSAAQLDQWQESLRILSQLPQHYPESSYVAEALYEIAWAHQNLDQPDQALEQYEQAATSSRGEVGARARFMMGELYFARKDFTQAERQFQRVMFGFGGQQAPADVKNWQAKSAFEAGRIAETQISAERNPQERAQHIASARKYYGELVRNHPQHELTAQAQRRLEALENQ